MTQLPRCLLSSKYDTKDPKEFKDFDLKEKLPGIEPILASYVASSTTAEALARSIIRKLFDRDFSGGERWCVGGAYVAPLGGDSFECSCEATYDFKDIYAQAEAKCRITVTKEVITIADYGYYCAG